MPEAEDVLPAAGRGRRDRCTAGTPGVLGVAGVTVVLPELPGVLVVPPPGSSPLDPGEDAEVIRGNGHAETLHHTA